MAFEGWLTFGGVELINNLRAGAYAAGSGIRVANHWPDLPASLSDAPYLDPVTDEAPWYDPSRPESKGFYGLVGLELIGASTGRVTRSWTELIGDGGVPGASRRASAEIEVRAVALAADRAALSYGLAWLASALRGQVCADSCAGDEVCVYAACPARPSLRAEGCDLGSPDPTWDPVHGGPEAPGGDQLLRRLYTAALTEGPQVTSTSILSGGVAAQLRFVLRAGTPFWYSEPAFVIYADGVSGPSRPDTYRDTILDYDPYGWIEDCDTPVDCLAADPFCVVSAAPPAVAPAPPDPCFPNHPANGDHTFAAARAIFSIPRGTGADWLEKVPIIRLFTGSLPWYRLIVRWYDNPGGTACGPDLNPCHACAEIQVPWVPRGSLLTLDGRTSRATLDCPGPGPELTTPRLYGPAGGPFRWPVFECSATLCCEIIGDVTSLAADAWMDIHMATRSDLI